MFFVFVCQICQEGQIGTIFKNTAVVGIIKCPTQQSGGLENGIKNTK